MHSQLYPNIFISNYVYILCLEKDLSVMNENPKVFTMQLLSFGSPKNCLTASLPTVLH